MKNKYLMLTFLTVSTLSFANYELVFPMPSSNIKFVEKVIVDQEPELPIIYGDWLNNGEVYDCNAPSPLRSTVNINISMQQSQSCSQEQVRSVQNSNITEEFQVVTVNNIINTYGTLDCKTFVSGGYGFVNYGSVSNGTGAVENPNNGTRLAWNNALIYTDLNQTKKVLKNELDLNGYKYKRYGAITNRTLTFESYNYRAYDSGICRHPIE